MSDEIAVLRALKDRSKLKRESNRSQSAKYLLDREIPFTEHNNGAHLIIEGQSGWIDFWPGTGRWNNRRGKSGFGVRNLVTFILEEKKENHDVPIGK